MRAQASRQNPFDEGRLSVQSEATVVNPYAEGSVEHRNFELGRAFGVRNSRGVTSLGVRNARA